MRCCVATARIFAAGPEHRLDEAGLGRLDGAAQRGLVAGMDDDGARRLDLARRGDQLIVLRYSLRAPRSTHLTSGFPSVGGHRGDRGLNPRAIPRVEAHFGNISLDDGRAEVAARISSRLVPGRARAAQAVLGRSITASSVTIRVTRRLAVSGSVHSGTIFGCPFAAWIIATTTCFAPATRSIAPPMPGTILPGTVQLAEVAAFVDLQAAQDRHVEMAAADQPEAQRAVDRRGAGHVVTNPPPASVRFTSSMPSGGRAPSPITPFSA